jgi:tRNA A-37 threonylcarbamoyl transferase component Bud32
MTCNKIHYKIAPGFEGLESWVKNLPGQFASNGITVFKDRNEVKVFEESGIKLNVKAFKLPNLVNRFAYVYLRGSKAARSFQNACRFLEAGASTPAPVAYVECLSNGQLKESFYITLQYNHGFTLRDVLNYLVPDREDILVQWVRFTWSQLHRNGIFHLDYSPGNTLIYKGIENYDFAVVDLNRMEFIPVDFKKGIQNFRQLDTDEETLRLIAAEYARLCKEPAGKAISMLLRYDKSNKAYRRRKGNFKNWMRGTKSEA